jgi:hypothetical protein
MWENLAGERRWLGSQPLRALRNLEKVTIIIPVRSSKAGSVTYSLVDSALDIRHRTTRRAEIGEKIADSMVQFLKLSQHDPDWKVPTLEYKIRLSLGKKELLGMEKYYAEGFLPRTYDDGWSSGDGYEDCLE